MRAMNGVSKNRHGVYYARKKVPKQLEQATAEVLGNGKSRQVFLKRSLDTKDLREANIRAKPVLMEFDRILAQAEALTVQRPMRTTLEKREIEQITNYFFAHQLAADDEDRRDRFRTLQGSTATGAQNIKRLTNLMQLTVDTSWWTRYRSRTQNPDFGDTLPPAIPGLIHGQF